jgi:hypothetical protein
VDLLFGHSRGQAVEDDAHRDARTAYPSLTVYDLRVGIDEIRGSLATA